ncbi:MAG TPA: hypothetical protein VHT96_18110 [Clostridia bacterium]|nr:hypothetical protein [Clostridia bacterium]
MRRAVIALLVIIFATALTYAVFSHNSLSFAIRSAGYNSGNVTILERGFDDNGREFGIIKTDRHGEPALLYMEKNSLEFWKVSYSDGNTSSGKHLVSLGWLKSAGFRRYGTNENPDFSNEWHMLYYGNNAAKLIEITPEQLPPGVACNIQQGASDFVIHLISYESPETLNKIDIHSLLINMNSIVE